MNNINTEDSVRITKKFINLFVNEGKSMVDNRDKDHDKNLTEKDNIHTNCVGNKVDPEDDIENWLGHSLPDKWQLVHCWQNCPVGFITNFVASVSAQFSLLFSDLQSIFGDGTFAEESVIVALEDEKSRADVEHDLPGDKGFPCETDNTFIWSVSQQISKMLQSFFP